MNRNKKIIIIISGIVIASLIVIAYLLSLKKDDNVYQNQVQNISSGNNVISNTNDVDEEEIFSVKVQYQENTVRKIAKENGEFSCTENIPTITGVEESAARRMESRLKSMYQDTWTEIKKQADDNYVNNILMKAQNSAEKYKIGFHQTAKVVFESDKVITFECYLTGDLGGVSWNDVEGVSFDRQTGEVIQLANIITSEEDYINACKRSIFPQMRSDSRAQYLNSGYEKVVNDEISKKKGYFTKNGITCVKIPGYKLSNQVSDDFVYTVPYDAVKEYIKSDYIPSK